MKGFTRQNARCHWLVASDDSSRIQPILCEPTATRPVNMARAARAPVFRAYAGVAWARRGTTAIAVARTTVATARKPEKIKIAFLMDAPLHWDSRPPAVDTEYITPRDDRVRPPVDEARAVARGAGLIPTSSIGFVSRHHMSSKDT